MKAAYSWINLSVLCQDIFPHILCLLEHKSGGKIHIMRERVAAFVLGITCAAQKVLTRGGEACACMCYMTDSQSVPPLFLPHLIPRALPASPGPCSCPTSPYKPQFPAQLSALQRLRLVLCQSLWTCSSLCLPFQTSLLGWFLIT